MKQHLIYPHTNTLVWGDECKCFSGEARSRQSHICKGVEVYKKSLKILLFSSLMSLALASECPAEYNLATKQDENLLFSTASEVKLGRTLAQGVEKKLKICKDEKLQERIDKIGQKLVAVCGRNDISYSFIVLDEEKVNAFALPGGYIYINKGATDKADSDDEIAGVLAHEVAHVAARHSMKQLQAALGYNLLSILALAATKDPRFKRGTDLAFAQIMLGFTREDELLADQLSVQYLRQAGYNPETILSFFEKLKQMEKEAPLRPLVAGYARTHPYLAERLGAVKQEIYGKLDFNDYINKGLP